MAEIKYIPAEIDGVNQTERIERLLQALDVFLDSQWSSTNVNDGFNEVYTAIQNIETGDRDLHQILSSMVVGQTLINFDGNLLTRNWV